MGMVPTYYTAAMMEDGYPMLTRVEQRLEMIPNIIMPLTATDASAMQLRLFNIIEDKLVIKARVGSAGGAFRARQVAMFKQARQNMINIAANEYNDARAARQPERDQIKATKEEAKKDNWSRGKRNQALDLIRAQFTGKRKEARTAKDTAKKAKSAEVKTEVDKTRAARNATKEKIALAKAKLTKSYRALDNPTPDDKKDYRKKMAAIEKMAPSNKQRFVADNYKGKMVSLRAKREADGTYSTDTKNALKARRLKDIGMIDEYGSENPDQRGAKRSADIKTEKERIATLLDQGEDAKAKLRQANIENMLLRNNDRDFGGGGAIRSGAGGPGIRQIAAEVGIPSGEMNQPNAPGVESQANPAGRFGGRRMNARYQGASAGI